MRENWLSLFALIIYLEFRSLKSPAADAETLTRGGMLIVILFLRELTVKSFLHLLNVTSFFVSLLNILLNDDTDRNLH